MYAARAAKTSSYASDLGGREIALSTVAALGRPRELFGAVVTSENDTRKAKEKLDADLDKLDAAECVANALLQEQTQPTDELVQCARADEAAVRGADDVTERRADQRLPPLAAEYVRPQRVRRAPTFGYDKHL